MMANFDGNLVKRFNLDIVPYQYEPLARDMVITRGQWWGGNEANDDDDDDFNTERRGNLNW
jgi:hypothetical protein